MADVLVGDAEAHAAPPSQRELQHEPLVGDAYMGEDVGTRAEPEDSHLWGGAGRGGGGGGGGGV